MNIVEKLGLYDILAMFIPGYLLVCLFDIKGKGLVLDNLYHELMVVVACYVIGLVWHKLMELVFRPLRNNELGLALGRAIAYGETSKRRGKTIEAEPNIRTKYYEAYYRLGAKLGAIPVIERQVALLQNLMFILPFFVAKYVSIPLDTKSLCLVSILPLVTLVAMGYSYRKEFTYKDVKRHWVCKLVKCLGFIVYAFGILCFLGYNVKFCQDGLDEVCCAIIISFLIILGVYLLLQIKVYSMVWEADAYVTEDPKDLQKQRGEQTVS